MDTISGTFDNSRYARCISASKRVRWDIEQDVIRNRRFDLSHKYLPDGLSMISSFTTLSDDEKRFVSQIQDHGAPDAISAYRPKRSKCASMN